MCELTKHKLLISACQTLLCYFNIVLCVWCLDFSGSFILLTCSICWKTKSALSLEKNIKQNGFLNIDPLLIYPTIIKRTSPTLAAFPFPYDKKQRSLILFKGNGKSCMHLVKHADVNCTCKFTIGKSEGSTQYQSELKAPDKVLEEQTQIWSSEPVFYKSSNLTTGNLSVEWAGECTLMDATETLFLPCL